MPSDADRRFLARAFELARGGFGRTAPNPPVGALLVRDGEVVGEGFHAVCGGPHAEVVALEQAGGRARGAVLYVTLEPCAHQGRTGPCTTAIIEAGVARVVHAVGDPSPQVAGRGLACLAAAGVETGPPLLPEEGRALAAPFHWVHRAGRPYTVLKWAASLDGRIATRAGQSRWISGEASRRTAHRLRALCGVVAVGSRTAATDDPLLDVRDVEAPRQPVRLVVDSGARLALQSRLARTAREQPTLVAHVAGLAGGRDAALEAAGCSCVETPAGPDGRVDLAALWRTLAARGLQSVLVEGGGELCGALLEAGLVDAVVAFVAPLLIGGAGAPGPIGGAGPEQLTGALGLTLHLVRRSGEDVLLLAAPAAPWHELVEALAGPV